MKPATLNLVVLRVSDVEVSARFYSALGLSFERHRHGSGPQHLAAEHGGCIFELYPASPKYPVSGSVRIGFRVDSVERIIALLGEVPERLISPPTASEWGLRAVLADPDGHRVELIES